MRLFAGATAIVLVIGGCSNGTVPDDTVSTSPSASTSKSDMTPPIGESSISFEFSDGAELREIKNSCQSDGLYQVIVGGFTPLDSSGMVLISMDGTYRSDFKPAQNDENGQASFLIGCWDFQVGDYIVILTDIPTGKWVRLRLRSTKN